MVGLRRCCYDKTFSSMGVLCSKFTNGEKMKTILIVLGLVLSASCFADESNVNESSTISTEAAKVEKQERTAVQKFRGDTQFRYLKCQLMIENENLSLKYQGSVKCLSDAREAVKEKYKNAEVDVSKNTETAKFLKEYYVLWLTALSSLERGQGERKSDHSKRMADANSKAEEAWNRFEIESAQ